MKHRLIIGNERRLIVIRLRLSAIAKALDPENKLSPYERIALLDERADLWREESMRIATIDNVKHYPPLAVGA